MLFVNERNEAIFISKKGNFYVFDFFRALKVKTFYDVHRINLKVRHFCAFAKITVMPLDKKGRKKDRFTEIQCNQVDLMCIQLSRQYKLGKLYLKLIIM